jgi:hypothetical protein
LCLHAAPYFDVSINPITSCHFFSSHICVTVTRLSPLRILRTLLPHRGRGHPLVVRPLGSCSVGRRGTTIINKDSVFPNSLCSCQRSVRSTKKTTSSEEVIVFFTVRCRL